MSEKYTHSPEVRAQMSESHLKFNQSPAGIAKRKKLSELRKGIKITDEARENMRKAQSGKNNSSWAPFEIIVTLPTEEVKSYTFDGDTPFADCTKMFGLQNYMKRLKQGETVTITYTNCNTKHPWPKGTTVILNKLTN